MPQKIFLSIITATKDIILNSRQDQLKKCIESIAKISIPHEHLICDGGSLDGTLNILSEYIASHNVRVISKKDNGIYDAFNNGVCHARGSWIYFIGSDDYLCAPSELENALKLAEESNADMTISPVQYSDGIKRFSSLKDCGNILIIKPYCHQGVLMRKKLIMQLGLFDNKYRIASDFKLCLQAHLANARHIFINKIYACFSVENGISNTCKNERNERLEISREILRIANNEKDKLFSKQLLPFRIIKPLLFHKNPMIRQGARYAFARRIADICALLDDNGGPKQSIISICQSIAIKIRKTIH
jgi:glycosyltransferase involved in cell wall biosynthesis